MVKASIHRPHGVLLTLAVLMLAAGCATKASVQTSRDGTANFSGFRSWSWLPDAREDERPHSDDEHELASLVFEQIHQELSERGFSYRRKNADLAVDARLTVTREQHVTHRNTAIESLNSFHGSPSYEIHATEREIVIYQRGRLTIRVIDLRRKRVVWQGIYESRHRDPFAAYVKAAVASTLESLPAVPGGDPSFDSHTVATHP
jgi:hypothetical protein